MSLAVFPPAGSSPSAVVTIDLIGGRIAVSGRLDRSTVHLLHDAISALLGFDHPSWSLDLTGLTSCDDIGLRGLGAAYRRAFRHHRHLTLAGAPARVRGNPRGPEGGTAHACPLSS